MEKETKEIDFDEKVLEEDDVILQAMLDAANDPDNEDKADKLHQMIVDEVEKNKFSDFEEVFPEK